MVGYGYFLELPISRPEGVCLQEFPSHCNSNWKSLNFEAYNPPSELLD